MDNINSHDERRQMDGSMEREAEQIREEVERDMPLFHDDPDPDALVDENPDAPNGMTGDHEDDFDIG